ncbi:MAG: DUF2442 domain-containing protein [Pyrinomonadaceae bacterium]
MRGELTLTAEITDISANGIWLLLDGEEKFLSYEDSPWFRFATVDEVLTVERIAPHHLYWEKLDVDIHVDSIDHPEQHPLKAKVNRTVHVPQT